jgi:serine/threonine protein kinase
MGCTSSSTGESSCSFNGKYKLGQKLGEGGFGQVRSVEPWSGSCYEDWQTNGGRAVKILFIGTKGRSKRRLVKPDPIARKRAEREVAAWTAVSGSEHCAQLLETFREGPVYYMVMEECRCSVLNELGHMAKISEADIARVFHEMLLSVAHIHERGIMHRDIKPANFLFGGSDGHTVKLCDFGLATAIPSEGKLTSECGTSPYKAPEMIEGSGYLEKVDLWSLGVTAYLMLFGDFPYFPANSHFDFEDAILSGAREPDYKRITSCQQAPSELASNFVRALLVRSAATRCTATAALKDPFILEHVNGDAATKEELSSASLLAVIGSAKQRTREFDIRIDPTEQRTIEEILELLHDNRSKPETPGVFSRRFSGSFAVSRIEVGDESSGGMSSRRLSKSGTHCGTLTFTAKDFWDDAEKKSTVSTDVGDLADGQLDEMQELDALEAKIWMNSPHAIGS